MVTYTDFPVYRVSYALLLKVSELMPHLPRDSRYTIGQSLREKLLEIIMLIYRASRTPQKVPVLGHMRETLSQVQVLMRLLCDLHQISERQYTQLMEEASSLSKQISAWERSERKKTNDNIRIAPHLDQPS